MSEEIRFLYDEITEKINKDVERILFHLRNPFAGKNVYILKRFTEELIRARARQMHQQEFMEIEEVKHEEVKQPVEITVLEVKPAEQIQIQVPEQYEEKNDFVGYQPSSLQEKKRNETDKPRNIIQMNLITDNETKDIVARGEIEENEYRIYEPTLSEDDLKLLNKAKEAIGNDMNSLTNKKLLWKILRKNSKDLNVYFDDDNLLKLRYYLVRDFMGYGAVEAFMHDKGIEKIICEGQGEKVIVIKDGKKYRTNVAFKSKDELNSFLINLAARTFQKISLDDPVLDVIYRGFRIQGTLGTDVVPSKFIMTRV